MGAQGLRVEQGTSKVVCQQRRAGPWSLPLPRCRAGVQPSPLLMSSAPFHTLPRTRLRTAAVIAPGGGHCVHVVLTPRILGVAAEQGLLQRISSLRAQRAWEAVGGRGRLELGREPAR